MGSSSKYSFVLGETEAAIVQLAIAAFCNVPATAAGREQVRELARRLLNPSTGSENGRRAIATAADNFARRHVLGPREPDAPKKTSVVKPTRKGDVLPFKPRPRSTKP